MNDAGFTVIRVEEAPGLLHWIRVVFAEREPLMVPLRDWVEFGGHTGMRLTDADVAALERCAAAGTARDRALSYLKARPRTEEQVLAYLTRRGVEEAVAQRVVADLRTQGLVDDAAYARDYAEFNGGRMSRRELAWRLRQSGVRRVDAALVVDHPEARERERAAARRLAQAYVRKHASRSTDGLRHRLAAYLQRKGFPTSLILEVLREMDLDLPDLFS
ncbi:MAG: RecX family transcriptional regulator [Alicyclobacillus macrosporangiidus]|uniref:regulatory protein RecX n=1 Tax=Alicyclobacillus macrosporangiidus TaxID=392015 RepID=UPI0026EA7C00|nr:RecX family transcriptional regulator [Alicyclobacillus macrosporangiidus]MCL6597299.1 RecX family transcriptional regulator [Alicyclobacillus macrosporangiidus]